MFCPGCGLEDIQANQFCRACGTELRFVRSALERPDNITASAVTARDEIGRAVAVWIRENTSAQELKKVAEDVLPQIEKFLESPEEKRMRRVRTGSIVSFVGLGSAVAFALASIFGNDPEFLFFAALGVVCLFVGLSFVVNGLLFTVPKKSLADKSEDADHQRRLDAQTTSELVLPASNQIYTSVTEHTTRHLGKVKSEK